MLEMDMYTLYIDC